MEHNHVSWINPKLEVKDSSTHGVGTFTKSYIKKGEIVIVQGGKMITEKEFYNPKYTPNAYNCFQVEKDVYICPINARSSSLDGIFKVNHSCNPTCGFRGQVTLVALRDIHIGEEITYDYAMTDMGSRKLGWKDMKCNCGSMECRKNITGEDWKLPNLQKKYRGFFSKYIQNAINDNR